MEAEAALELGQSILDILEDDIGEDAYQQAADYFESVKDKTESIMESIEEWDNATDGQVRALENMKAGLERWVH